jgi:hypothetical protein
MRCILINYNSILIYMQIHFRWMDSLLFKKVDNSPNLKAL